MPELKRMVDLYVCPTLVTL